MKDLKTLLKNHPALSDWRITEKAIRSYELFFVHRDLETVRATDTLSTEVTVYVDHDGKRGDSAFAVTPAMSEREIAAKIELAIARAKLVDNQPYTLPGADTLSAALPTDLDGYEPRELARQIADAVYAADTVEGGSINALEIFLYRDTLRVQNSRGVDKTQVTHRVMIEAIPTFTDERQSVELYEDHRFTAFDPAKVTAEIAEKMRQVKDRAAAQKPKTPLTVNVVLRPKEIAELIGELAYDANYAAVYAHANLHQKGDDWQQGGDGDKLTVTMKGVLEGSEKSAYFDADGMALTDTAVIENGVVQNYFGASRFGQYLGVDKPTGSLRCAEVAPGTLTDGQIRQAPYIECVSLSGLQLELYSDYIGGEIRLAYYFDGQKTVPVTGISMSAKLSEVLAGLRLSADVVTEGGYRGPAKLLMKDVAVL
ncbi:MAG: metallopeptidase TldD-related protein [Acutalibacteraceae bacterium]|jgi:predicted Zn-dependent protease